VRRNGAVNGRSTACAGDGPRVARNGAGHPNQVAREAPIDVMLSRGAIGRQEWLAGVRLLSDSITAVTDPEARPRFDRAMASSGHCCVYLHRHLVAGREAPPEVWAVIAEGLPRIADHYADIDDDLANGWGGSPSGMLADQGEEEASSARWIQPAPQKRRRGRPG
jgi:hypothetical protein